MARLGVRTITTARCYAAVRPNLKARQDRSHRASVCFTCTKWYACGEVGSRRSSSSAGTLMAAPIRW